jgi:hypothetical protein
MTTAGPVPVSATKIGFLATMMVCSFRSVVVMR